MQVPFETTPTNDINDDFIHTTDDFEDYENNDDEQPPSTTQENEGDVQEEEQTIQEEATALPKTTRSGRAIRLTKRLQESTLLPMLRSFLSMTDHVIKVVSRLDDNSLNALSQLVAYPASIADADTMYLQQAMKQEDRDEFLKAMIKEIEDHTVRGHWRITTRKEMRERSYHHKPIAAIWSFKRKRNPFGQITKYKARLCCC